MVKKAIFLKLDTLNLTKWKMCVYEKLSLKADDEDMKDDLSQSDSLPKKRYPNFIRSFKGSSKSELDEKSKFINFYLLPYVYHSNFI